MGGNSYVSTISNMALPMPGAWLICLSILGLMMREFSALPIRGSHSRMTYRTELYIYFVFCSSVLVNHSSGEAGNVVNVALDSCQIARIFATDALLLWHLLSTERVRVTQGLF